MISVECGIIAISLYNFEGCMIPSFSSACTRYISAHFSSFANCQDSAEGGILLFVVLTHFFLIRITCLSLKRQHQLLHVYAFPFLSMYAITSERRVHHVPSSSFHDGISLSSTISRYAPLLLICRQAITSGISIIGDGNSCSIIALNLSLIIIILRSIDRDPPAGANLECVNNTHTDQIVNMLPVITCNGCKFTHCQCYTHTITPCL